MKKCPKCGSKIRTDSAFCENCGARLSSGKFLKQAKRKSHKKLWIPVALIVVCVLGSLIMFLKPFQKGKKQVTVASAEEAINQLKEMGQEFGLKNGLSELTEKYTAVIDGNSYYRLHQNYQGIPVYGRTAVCAADASGQVISVTGNITDVPEDIDLNPAVSHDQIIESVRMYLTDNLGVKNVDSLEISEPGQENVCIYNMGDMEKASLAYCMNVGTYEIVVDAENGAVLNACPTVYSANESLGMVSAIGYMASDEMRENGFNIIKCTDTYYIMKDASRNVSVNVLDGNLFKEDNLIWPERAVLVESSDEIFGNTETEAALEYEKGAKLLLNVAKISDYFEQLGFSASGTGTCLYYNDGYDQGQNAQGGYGDLYNNGKACGILAIGTVTGVNDIDVICHEYAHRVSGQLIGFRGGSVQTGAINEGLSDIFGELLEALIFRKTDTPDWVMLGDNISVRRNIANPRETGDLETASDDYDGSNPNYAYSTVISHAAYLMWNGIDGSNAKKISAENLAKLWYRAMLLMPADCDFASCRRMVELAALSVNGLTETQRECIAEAFDIVGIHKPEVSPEILISCDYNAKPNSVLNVFNASGELHPRYTLSISGTIAEHELAYSTDILTDIGYRYEKTVEVKKATSYKLNLPDGYYTLTVSDRHNPQYTYSFTVSISDKGTEDIIGLYTDFEDQLIVQITEETKQSENPSTAEKQLTQINAYNGKKLAQVNVTYSDGSKGQTVFKYNSSGLLASSVFTSAYSDGSQETVYSYDRDNRLTTVQPTGDHWHAGFPSAEYNYDVNGYLIRSADSEGSTIEYLYENDSAGLPVKVTMNSDFRTTVSNYTYSESGNAAEVIISVTDYQGNQSQDYASYKFTYDILGRIQNETRTGTDYSYNHNYIYDYFPFVCVASGSSTPHKIYIADVKGHPIWEIENVVVKSMKQDADGYLTQLITDSGDFYEFVYETQKRN